MHVKCIALINDVCQDALNLRTLNHAYQTVGAMLSHAYVTGGCLLGGDIYIPCRTTSDYNCLSNFWYRVQWGYVLTCCLTRLSLTDKAFAVPVTDVTKLGNHAVVSQGGDMILNTEYVLN